MRTRFARYQIFFELTVLLSIVSVSAVLLAQIWLHSMQPAAAVYAPTAVATSLRGSTPVMIAPIQSDTDEAAPDFTLTAFDGQVLTLSALHGHPLVLNFWASWCESCRAEAPALTRAYQTYRDQGLMIIGVNVTVEDNIENARAFVDEFAITYLVVFDETGIVSLTRYGVVGLPTSVFVKADGVIQRVVMGELTATALERYVSEIMPISGS